MPGKKNGKKNNQPKTLYVLIERYFRVIIFGVFPVHSTICHLNDEIHFVHEWQLVFRVD